MKQISILIAIVLLLSITVQASHQKHNAQQKLGKEQLVEKLKKSHFGKAIIDMMEVSMKVGSDFGPLFEALTALKNSLLEKKETEIQDFQSDGIQHENDVVRLNGEIQTQEQNVQQYTEDIDSLHNNDNILRNGLAAQEHRLSEGKNEKDFEEQYLANLETRWEADRNDYGTALQILDQCIELLDQSRGYSGSAFTSFIQTSSEHFKKASKKLKKIGQMEQLSDEAFFITPIAEVFAQLAKGDELDLVATTQARNAIQGLKDHLMASLEALNGIYTQDKNDHTNVLTTLNNEVNTLSNQTIPQTTRDIQSNDDAIKEKDEQLSLARANLQFNKGQLILENQSWDQRIELNTLLLPQYDNEYAVVIQAEAVIKNAVGNK